jgi:hypothetical protein
MLTRLALRSAATAFRYSSTTVAAPSASVVPSVTNLTAFAAGALMMVPVIAFAPANEFDDLDVHSHCQRKCVEGACLTKE